MGRPKVPLIAKDTAVAKALEIIDRDGIEALSIRRLGDELGVNGASLYHHFSDKDEILAGVRDLILGRTRLPSDQAGAWQDFAVAVMKALRQALIRHPNAAPLMLGGGGRPPALPVRDVAASVLMGGGVPTRYVVAVLDGIETLAFGTALMNPMGADARSQYGAIDHDYPNLGAALDADRFSAEQRFDLACRVFVDGWALTFEREPAGRGRRGVGRAASVAKPAGRARVSKPPAKKAAATKAPAAASAKAAGSTGRRSAGSATGRRAASSASAAATSPARAKKSVTGSPASPARRTSAKAPAKAAGSAKVTKAATRTAGARAKRTSR